MTREKLARTYEKARKDAIVFAVLVVLLTPGLIGLSALGLGYALMTAGGGHDTNYASSASMLLGANVSLAAMLLMGLLSGQRSAPRSLGWSAASIACFGAVLFACYVVKLDGAALVVTYAALAIAMLTCAGHGYLPRSEYYLGFYGADNPFTFRDDIDRTHLALGVGAAFPRLIFLSYGELLGSSWMWRRLEDDDLRAMTEIMDALFRRKVAPLSALRSAVTVSPEVAKSALLALARLELVRRAQGGLELTLAGRDLMQAAGAPPPSEG